jgi:hypothetical protein
MVVQPGETYIGDGVYVRFDGYQLLLRTPRENGDHVIALEPAVYFALRDYARKIWGQCKEDSVPAT